MADTYTYSGSLQILAQGVAAISGDNGGQKFAKFSLIEAFAAAGGTAPTLAGWVKGSLTVAAGDLLLAHATDPFQSMGDAEWSPGFVVDGDRLKLLIIKNTHASLSFDVARAAANGLPIFSAAGDGFRLAPGDVRVFYIEAGTDALSTGVNDALTLTPVSGSPTAEIVAFYGP